MLRRLFLDRAGAVAAEYALILEIIGAAIAGAAFHLATAQASAVASASNAITDPGAAGANATGG